MARLLDLPFLLGTATLTGPASRGNWSCPPSRARSSYASRSTAGHMMPTLERIRSLQTPPLAMGPPSTGEIRELI